MTSKIRARALKRGYSSKGCSSPYQCASASSRSVVAIPCLTSPKVLCAHDVRLFPVLPLALRSRKLRPWLGGTDPRRVTLVLVRQSGEHLTLAGRRTKALWPTTRQHSRTSWQRRRLVRESQRIQCLSKGRRRQQQPHPSRRRQRVHHHQLRSHHHHHHPSPWCLRATASECHGPTAAGTSHPQLTLTSRRCFHQAQSQRTEHSSTEGKRCHRSSRKSMGGSAAQRERLSCTAGKASQSQKIGHLTRGTASRMEPRQSQSARGTAGTTRPTLTLRESKCAKVTTLICPRPSHHRPRAYWNIST
jgi:hypothetical protein